MGGRRAGICGRVWRARPWSKSRPHPWWQAFEGASNAGTIANRTRGRVHGTWCSGHRGRRSWPHQRFHNNTERPQRVRDRTRFVGELAPVSAIRRYLNQNPYIDNYVSKRALYYREKYDVSQAHDAITIATTASVKASIERYLQPRIVGSISDARADLIVRAMASHFADVFDANYIVHPRAVARSLPRAYSPGVPFIGQKLGNERLSTRRSLWSSGLMDTMVGIAKDHNCILAALILMCTTYLSKSIRLVRQSFLCRQRVSVP